MNFQDIEYRAYKEILSLLNSASMKLMGVHFSRTQGDEMKRLASNLVNFIEAHIDDSR